MSRFLPLFLPVLVSIFLVKFFQWPFPYYMVTDQLYGTVGINYQNLVLDFLVFFLIGVLITGILEFLLVFVVFRSLIKEVEEKK